MNYVVGFMFNEDKTKVALIKKLTPKFQKNLYNGIGGKIKDGEIHIDAMTREFYEETGYLTKKNCWNLYAIIDIRSPANNETSIIYFFTAVGDLDLCKTTTEEEVKIFDIDKLPENIVKDLSWLIPKALDFFNGDRVVKMLKRNY